jgi:uncharacterized protein YbaP (TraB family)
MSIRQKIGVRHRIFQKLAWAWLLPLAACAGQAGSAAAPEGHPAMWKLADSDTNIYLLGTIHMLPEGQAWRTPAFDAALASSDELVLEIANVDDLMAAAQALQKLGMSPGLPPILERVPAEKRPALKAMIAESGYLLAVSFKRLGLDPSRGVERQIGAPFRAAGKPVTGLETVEQQFGFFDTLSEEAQRTLLLAVVEDSAESRAEFRAMLDAWSTGDVAGVARTFDGELRLTPELRTALIDRRNAHWAEWLAQRLGRPGTVFVAVGAGHLAGEESVQALLKAKGLKAKRVQ